MMSWRSHIGVLLFTFGAVPGAPPFDGFALPWSEWLERRPYGV
jgi:hypothetical protein